MRARVWQGKRKSQKAWPCARVGVSGDASLSAASGRSGLRAGSERAQSGLGAAPGSLARQRRGFARFELRGRHSILVRSGADFVAGAPLSQGQLFSTIELRGRRSILVRSGADFVAGAALSQGQFFPRLELRGRRSTFDSSGADFRSSADIMAGAALSQGQVPNSWQARHSRNFKVAKSVARGLKIAIF